MAKYKGKYKGTVKARDVGRSFGSIIRLHLPQGLGWGKIQPIDVGKKIYCCKGQHYIENTDQMLARLSSLT